MLSASSGVMHNNMILYILHVASIIPRTVAEKIREMILGGLLRLNLNVASWRSSPFLQEHMQNLNHLVLNTERVVYPNMMANNWCDTDQQGAAIRQACLAVKKATGFNFHPRNIKNFNEVLHVTAAMERISDERQDAAFRKEEEEEEEAEKASDERNRKREQEEEEARKRKKEHKEQPPKARGKYKTFEDRMEDLKRYEETHDHANVSIREDKSLYQFCASVRNVRKTSKGIKLTDERTAAFDALGFIGRRRNTSRGRSTRGSKTPWSTSRRAVTSM